MPVRQKSSQLKRIRLKAVTCLSRLEKSRSVFTTEAATRKLELLSILERGRLNQANRIKRFHELLCFIRAYPDNPEVFQLSDRILRNFYKRSDLKRLRKLLINSGIAGTVIEYRFFWPMARWLSRNWPEQLQLLWTSIDKDQQEKLLKILPLLIPAGEASVFDEFDFSVRDWIKRLKANAETDAVFYINRIGKIYRNDLEREQLHDDLDLTYRLVPGATSPAIGTTMLGETQITYQAKSMRNERADLVNTLRTVRYDCLILNPARAVLLIDLAKRTMITHARDLDVFAYGNPHDVTLVDFRDGYQIACIGIIPERRYLLHASYGLLTFKNGMPIGYCAISTVFNCAELAFNLFSAFRGGESSLVYSRILAIAHQLFGVNTFSVDPYQLGYNNKDGLKSGVWWFYYKLGFRPHAIEIAGLVKAELAKMKRDPDYRSGLSTLNQLAAGNMYFSMDGKGADVEVLPRLGYVPPGITAYLASRFGSGREQGLRICSQEAAVKTGIRPGRKLTANERQAWATWSPLLLNLGNLALWPLSERKQLARIACLKGAAAEITYLQVINQHRRLRQAILAFADRNSSL